MKLVDDNKASLIGLVQIIEYFFQSIHRLCELSKFNIESRSVLDGIVTERGLYGLQSQSKLLKELRTLPGHSVKHGIAKGEDKLAKTVSIEDVDGNSDVIVSYFRSLKDMLYKLTFAHTSDCRQHYVLLIVEERQQPF